MRKVEQLGNDELAARETRARDPAPTPWRTTELRARLAALNRRERPWLGIALAAVLLAGLVLVPRFVDGVTTKGVLYVEAPIAFLVLSLWRLRQIRVIREVGLNCPSCGNEQTKDLLYKGQCSRCHTWLLHPNELETPPAALITSGSTARNAIGLIVLFGLMAWGFYKTQELVSSNRADCARRYQAARTAADTSRLDSSSVCRSFRRR
jgi:hypothetical protein